MLFSFLLAVPVWAQDEVAPDPDAATPPGKGGAFRPSLVATLSLWGGGRTPWKKKASPSTSSTLPICRAIRREDCNNPGRDGKNTRGPSASISTRQRFLLELRCVAGRDVTGLGKSVCVELCLSTGSLLAGATNVSVPHQYRRESYLFRIRPFLASGQTLTSDLPGPS